MIDLTNGSVEASDRRRRWRTEGGAAIKAIAARHPRGRPAVVVAAIVIVAYLLPLFNLTAVSGSGISFDSLLFYPVGIYVLMAIGLDLMVGRAGLTNLCYAALFAAGAYTTALLSTKVGMPFWATVPVAIACGLVVGCLLSLVSFRAQGHYLAIVTLGAGLIVDDTLSNVKAFGGTLGIASIPHPAGFLGLQFTVVDVRSYDWLVVTAIVVTGSLVWWVCRGRAGRAWAAIREDELAAALAGVRVRRWKVVAFGAGGAIGGLAGSLYAGQVGYIDPTSFTLTLSVMLLAAVVLVGKGRLWSVIVGAILVAYIPERFTVIGKWEAMAFGLVLAGVMLFQPQGLAGLLDKLPGKSDDRDSASASDQVGSRPGARSGNVPVSPPTPVSAEAPVPARPTPGGLSVRGLDMHFGGLQVVNGLDLDVACGQVTSLIGPNGAGKTTVINLISGIYEPVKGSITLDGLPLVGRPPEYRARNGVARTFQNIRLFPNLTALDNVLVAAESRGHTGSSLAAIGGPHGGSLEWARECLDAVGMGGRCERVACTLSYGEQRRLEVARALALNPSVLLVDEPAAGSNPTEKVALGELLAGLAERGLAVLLVEHDMSLVMNISHLVVVMNFGVKIAQGTPDEVRTDPAVMAAYLGSPVGAA